MLKVKNLHNCNAFFEPCLIFVTTEHTGFKSLGEINVPRNECSVLLTMPGTYRHCLESELLKCDDPTPSNVVNSMLLAMWRATPCSSRYEHHFISILFTFNLPSSNKVPWSGSLTRLHCIRNCKTIALSMKDARLNLQRWGTFLSLGL